jgi:hypothetical protein
VATEKAIVTSTDFWRQYLRRVKICHQILHQSIVQRHSCTQFKLWVTPKGSWNGTVCPEQWKQLGLKLFPFKSVKQHHPLFFKLCMSELGVKKVVHNHNAYTCFVQKDCLGVNAASKHHKTSKNVFKRGKLY